MLSELTGCDRDAFLTRVGADDSDIDGRLVHGSVTGPGKADLTLEHPGKIAATGSDAVLEVTIVTDGPVAVSAVGGTVILKGNTDAVAHEREVGSGTIEYAH